MNKTKVTRAIVILTAAMGLTLAAAPAASARSFSGEGAAGQWSYDDGADRFCIFAWNGHDIKATLKPVTAGRGPSYTIRRSNLDIKCVSLSRAYEDTRYRLVTSGTNMPAKGKYFYS